MSDLMPIDEPKPTPKQAPQLAYEAYCGLLMGWAAVDAPAWWQIAPIMRQAWAAAAEAVREFERNGGER